MKTGFFKRICTVALAFAMLLSLAPAALSESAGNDGSAEMNEAYARKESLMPVGPSFNVDTLLEWTPESDPDARYNRASIALAERVGGFVVNPKANPLAKLMLCSLANSDHDQTGAQGSESFLSWSFNYWQYTDSFVYWAGSEEGLVVCPTGEFTDAAHTNGVPVVATLGFPYGSGTGYAQQVAKFCRKAEDGSFPVADKLLELMEFYGFDGYFFNQESNGCSPETARLLQEMMLYMRRKCPDILLSWYDSMIANGNVAYGNAVNKHNKLWMEPVADGLFPIDGFFMNYDWYDGEIAGTLETMQSIGRDPFDAYAGLDVQQNCMDTNFRDHLLLDDEGRLKLSLALYCPNSTLGLSPDGAAFHRMEQAFYTNSAGDPRLETSDATSSINRKWVGISRFFADKTPITKAPFVTNFNSGHGMGYWVDGQLSRDSEWSYQSNQDVMPTWTWIIDSEGRKLTGAYDFTDAYNGGNSIAFTGALDAGKANHILLYSTHVAVAEGMRLRLTYRHNTGNVKLIAYYGDADTESYEACQQVAYEMTAGQGWTTTAVDISAAAGKILYALGIEVMSEADVEDCKVNLGQLAILTGDDAAPAAPETVVLDEILYRDAFSAEARVYWSGVAGATSYEVYRLCADGSKRLIMETPNTALYLPNVVRDAEQTDVTLQVVAISANGVRGEGQNMTIRWAHGNEDSERNAPQDLVNLCLNATITGVSFENSGEPASKALDGTAANNSKWCATNKTSGWMSIDLGREVTVRRWRVEHAEYGGEANNMNTLDFALEYKDESGSWNAVMRIKNNHDAVTDVLLQTPVTAREWRLRIYNDGSSAWSGIRIYEWQMFESDQFPRTEPVMMHFASAVNGQGATDSFVLRNVPAGQTVKLYTKNGDAYTQIAEQVAENNEVTFENLDFGTAEAGRIYYTTTAAGSDESIKQSAGFVAETAAVSAPATNVRFAPFSQPGSVSASRGTQIYTTVTVADLAVGDVIYIYENGADQPWTHCTLPVAEGETAVSLDRVRVERAGGQLCLQVKRAGETASEIYTVETPVFPEPLAQIDLTAGNAQGEVLGDAVYGVYNAAGEEVTRITAGQMAQVALGSYTLKCLAAPEGYAVSEETVKLILRSEGRSYSVHVVLEAKEEPQPEETQPTQPQETVPTQPQETKPTEPAQTQPQQTQPTVPATTDGTPGSSRNEFPEDDSSAIWIGLLALLAVAAAVISIFTVKRKRTA